MLQLGIVHPQDGAAVAAAGERGGNPADRLFIDQVVAAIQSVLMHQDQNFLFGSLDSTGNTVVDHVRQEIPCLLRDTDLSSHIFFLL